jgi:hypothetical protein
MKKIVTVIFIFLAGFCYGQDLDSTWTKHLDLDGFKTTISVKVINDAYGYRVIFKPSRHIPVNNRYYNVYFAVFKQVHDRRSAIKVIRKIEANEFKIDDEKS